MSRKTFEQAARELEREYGELLDTVERGDQELDPTRWSDDPVGFIREVLGDEPWGMQEEIAEAVRHVPQVSVRSCHAAGKDWLAARLALWWCYARDGLVVLTGPTAPQVEEILMRGELRDAFRRTGLPGKLHVKALRPGGGEGRAGVLAKTASGVSALTGFHEARVLFVITEAQDPEIEHAWDAAFACTTGAEDRILTLGNPTVQTGRFYRAHQPDTRWKTFKVAASDIPNVTEGKTVVSGLLTRQGVRRFAREYGEESGVYQSRVLAEFPKEAEDSLFDRSRLEAAAERWAKLEEDRSRKPLVAGLDPARRGPDASVLAIRRGHVLEDLYVWDEKLGAPELARKAAAVLESEGFRAAMEPQEDGSYQRAVGRVVVDEVGVGGGAHDILEEEGFRVDGFKAGRQAGDTARFANRKSEAFWHLHRLLERGEIALVSSEALVEELLHTRWRATPSGKVRVETKQDVRSHLGRSPDRADAVMMAFAERSTEKSGPTARVFSIG